MEEKKKPPWVKVNVFVDLAIKKKLDWMAVEAQMTRSEVVTFLVQELHGVRSDRDLGAYLRRKLLANVEEAS